MTTISSLVAEDLEFYHDKTGLARGRQALVDGIRNNICGKVTRELVPGTLQVDPIANYGAVEIGKKIITNDLKVEPIFSLLERKYGVPLIEAEYKLDAVAAENDVAAALKVKPRSPIFRIERTSYSTGRRPVDYEKLHYRGDLVQFVTRLVRKVSR